MRTVAPPLLSTVVGLVLVGCTYAPLQVDEFRPSVEESALEREFVVFGTASFRYLAFGDNGGVEICTVESTVEGYVPDEVPEGCQGCSEHYSLILTEDENDCDWGVTGVVSIGFDALESFPAADYPEWWNVMEENDAVGFVRTDWTPAGAGNWEPRLSLYEDEDGDWEDLGFARGYTAQSYYVFPSAYTVNVGGQDLRAYGGMAFTLRMQE